MDLTAIQARMAVLEFEFAARWGMTVPEYHAWWADLGNRQRMEAAAEQHRRRHWPRERFVAAGIEPLEG